IKPCERVRRVFGQGAGIDEVQVGTRSSRNDATARTQRFLKEPLRCGGFTRNRCADGSPASRAQSPRSGDDRRAPIHLDPRMGSASARQRVRPRTSRPSREFGEGELLRLVDRAPDVVFRYRLLPPGFDFVSSAITGFTGFAPDELYDDPASALEIVHPD